MRYQEIIRDKYQLLTKSERKLADFCIKEGQRVIHFTMSDLKKQIKVGDATIIRFCQKLGFSGFTDLKIAIAKEDFSNSYLYEVESDFNSNLLSRLIKTLKDTHALVQAECVEQAVELITQAVHIYIFGVGSSGTTANEFESILLRVGVTANAVIDPHIQSHIASIIGPNDLVIAFSLSGQTKDTYDSLLAARKSHAKIISITNSVDTPIARLADIVLQTSVEEFIDGGSVAGKFSQLYICDLLVKHYERLNNVETVEIREKVLRAILDKRTEL